MNQSTDNQNQFFNPLSAPVPPAPPAVGSELPKKSELPEKKAGINKTFIFVGFFLLVLAGLVYGLNKFTGIFSKASGECLPKNVRAVDLTASSADITFQTDRACQAEIAYGTSSQAEALLLQVPEPMASLNHRVRLTPLLPSTTYYYQIKVENKPVGEIYNFLTLPPSGGAVPTATKTPAIIPTASPTSAKSYTFEDFQSKFGTTNPSFDIDKNGVVNVRDWFQYSK